MKTKKRFPGLCLTLWLMLLLSNAVSALEKVNGVRVWKSPDSMRVVFDLSGSVKHTLFTLKNPDRVVIDFEDTLRTRALFNVDLKQGDIKKVRSAARNKDDLRVVLDLNKAMRAKSFLLKPHGQYGHRLVVDLSSAEKNRVKPVKSVADQGAGRDIVVAIDAGHGGEDPGAIGAGVYEKDVVLKIARQLKRQLSTRKGFKPVLIRDGDYYLKLKTRRDRAREKYKADLFVSIHADAFTDKRAHGASVFALSRKGATSTTARVLAETENKSDFIGGVSTEDKDEQLTSVLVDLAMEGSLQHSLKVGKSVLGQIGQFASLHKRHVEQAGFAVLKSPDIPSILVETGFISNPGEARKLKTPSYQEKMAKAIGNGIVAYFEQHPPPGTYLAMQMQNRSYRRHTIVRGETLSGIAAQYRVSMQRLRKVNALSDNDVIRIGQVLKIPST